jgi:hypothetical protein
MIEEFLNKEDGDEVVIDYLSGFYEWKSECIWQNRGWTHMDNYDENPKTSAYRYMMDENEY